MVTIERDDPWDTILAGSRRDKTALTIRDYAGMLKNKDRAGIAALIRLRFAERYLDPAFDNPKRNGFAMLAICCLMVEALESLRNGWKSTEGVPGGGEAVFDGFFQSNEQFRDLRPFSGEFYTHVRCGILHQAETTGCWRVNRSSHLLSTSGASRRVSASEFGKRLRIVFSEYTKGLANADWKSPLWINVRKKFRSVCANCGLPLDEVKRLQ